MKKVITEVGELVGALTKALEDGKVDAEEVKKISKEIKDVVDSIKS